MSARKRQVENKITMDSKESTHSKSDAIAGVVFLAALAIRFVFLKLVLDPSLSGGLLPKYPLLGEQILIGKGIAKQVFHSSPLYIYLWALFIKVCGLNLPLARVLHLILSAVNCCLIYFIGRKLFGDACALIASLAAACYAPFIVHDGTFITAVFVAFFNLTLILVLLYAKEYHDRVEKRSLRSLAWWLLAGIVLGLSIITRPNAILLLPVAVIWICIAPQRSACRDSVIDGVRKLLPPAAAFCIGAASIASMVTIRNYVVAGDPVIVTSSSGWIFYIGNNSLATGLLWTWPRHEPIVVTDKYETDPTHRVSREVASKLVGRELTPSEAARYWLSQGILFIREAPRKYLRLMLNKLHYFFNSFEPPDTREVFRRMRLIEEYPLLRFGFITPLALVGTFVCLTQWRRLWLLYGFSAVYFATAMIFFVNSRYRLPITPFFMLFAGHAVVWLVRKYREKSFPQAVAASLFVLAIFPLFNGEDFRIRNLKRQMEGHCDYLEPAQELIRVGRYEDAESLLKELMRREYTLRLTALAHQLLAGIYEQRGDREKALTENEKARGPICSTEVPYRFIEDRSVYLKQLEENPDSAWAHNCMGYLYWRDGDYEMAAREFEKVVELSPKLAMAHLNLAINYNLLHKHRESLREGKLSLQLAPSNPLARRELAYAREALKREGTR